MGLSQWLKMKHMLQSYVLNKNITGDSQCGLQTWDIIK